MGISRSNGPEASYTENSDLILHPWPSTKLGMAPLAEPQGKPRTLSCAWQKGQRWPASSYHVLGEAAEQALVEDFTCGFRHHLFSLRRSTHFTQAAFPAVGEGQREQTAVLGAALASYPNCIHDHYTGLGERASLFRLSFLL